MKTAHLLPAAIVCMVALTSCGRKAENEQGRLPVAHRFTFNLEGNEIAVRIAIRDEEQQQGLMWVKSMPLDEGMLFVFDEPQPMNFWMRNTLIPLDIGYFDSEGVLREIFPMYPHVEDPVLSRSQRIRYALEMNQGWYQAHGVKTGAQLDLNTLRDALRARGFDPDAFIDKR